MAARGEAAGVRDRPAGCATDREVVVVAAVLAAGSKKAAAHRLGLSRSTVKHNLANARSKVGAETTAQLVWAGGQTGDGRVVAPPGCDPLPGTASPQAVPLPVAEPSAGMTSATLSVRMSPPATRMFIRSD